MEGQVHQISFINEVMENHYLESILSNIAKAHWTQAYKA